MSDKIIRCTKKKVYLDIVGPAKKLPSDVLPTKADILRYYLCLQKNAFEIITNETLQIWKDAHIPTVSPSRVKQCLEKVHQSYRSISKYYNAKMKDSKFQEKLDAFQKEHGRLFDISACKCNEPCECITSKQVPELLRPFLKDQRSDRVMSINQIRDIISTFRQSDSCTDLTSVKENCSSDTGDESFDDPTDTDFVIQQPVTRKPRKSMSHSTKYNTMNIDALALVCDRYGVSDTAGAAISSATLQSVGLVKEGDFQLVIDKNKLKRARESVGEQLYSQRDDGIVGLYFDGRKDRTMQIDVSEDGIARKRFEKEEHISVISEPQSRYLGHVAVKRGKAVDIRDAIMESFGNLEYWAIGCDGTNCNTGQNGGIVRLIEVELNRPLQWLICELHLNELPFKALFAALDGETSGPTEFKGPIGKTLSESLKLDPVAFVPVPTKVKDFDGDIKTLSTDQLYLYEMCKAMSCGTCSITLSKRNPGAISNARWLTIANHILRTYVGTPEPSPQLKDLVTYIQNVYAPVWFNIKRNWKCVDGASNLHKLIKESRCLDKENRIIVDDSIQRNGFFAHHENLLLAMIRDKSKKIRSLAYRCIVKVRKDLEMKRDPLRGVRKFVVPKIKFGAKNYHSMINWTTTKITEPPLTTKFSLQELKSLAENRESSQLWQSDHFSIPCHTQAVERCVKVVTECSILVGSQRRDGYIRSKLKSRSIMPQFTSKKQFKLQTI